MNRKRLLLTLLGLLTVASITAAAIWRYAAESPVEGVAVARSVGTDTAPASRSIFPKVLNH